MKILEQKGYTYIQHISSGGQGTVHLIERDGHRLIAKIFPTMSEDGLELLQHIQQIQAPHVPLIHEIFTYDDQIILIRDYIHGHTLYQEIQDHQTLSLDRSVDIVLKLCETLQAFHSIEPHPIIYRDLKPDNIMISEDGDVFLIDFGISRYHKGEATRDTVLAGTRGYTAPEVLAGMQSDNRSDIYSVGLILYEMLTGKNLLVPPFQIRPVRESNPELPRWLDQVIDKSANINMVMRYRDITEFAMSLRRFKGRRQHVLRRMGYGAAILAAALAIGIFGIPRLNPTNPPDDPPAPYDLVVDITFDEMADFDQIQLVGEKIDSGEIQEADFPNLIRDGIYELRCQTVLNHRLSRGMFLHIRLRPEDMEAAGPLFFLSVLPEQENSAAYNMPFVNRERLGSEIVNEAGFHWMEAEGFPMIAEHRWMDIIIYMDERGETLRYFIFDTMDEPHMAYGGIRVLDEWADGEYSIEWNIPFEYWENEMNMPAPVTAVELIRMGGGSMVDYVREQISADTRHIEEMEIFLAQELESIPPEDYTPHGE